MIRDLRCGIVTYKDSSRCGRCKYKPATAAINNVGDDLNFWIQMRYAKTSELSLRLIRSCDLVKLHAMPF